jgi:LPXTG-motif cell wall-anchored protein
MKRSAVVILFTGLLLWPACSRSGRDEPVSKATETSQSIEAKQDSAAQQSEQPTKDAELAKAEARPKESSDLPKTASPLTWLGVIGLFSLAGALYLRKLLSWFR